MLTSAWGHAAFGNAQTLAIVINRRNKSILLGKYFTHQHKWFTALLLCRQQGHWPWRSRIAPIQSLQEVRLAPLQVCHNTLLVLMLSFRIPSGPQCIQHPWEGMQWVLAWFLKRIFLLQSISLTGYYKGLPSHWMPISGKLHRYCGFVTKPFGGNNAEQWTACLGLLPSSEDRYRRLCWNWLLSSAVWLFMDTCWM